MKRLVELALHSRLLVIVLGLLMMAAGFWGYKKLPVDAFPDVSPNLVQVFTVTDGLAPEEIEKYVTFPVESSMNGLPGVENIRSVSNFGLSVVNVYFEDGMDIYFCRQLVGERLTEARESIPDGFGEPAMGPISTGMGLVLFYYLEDTTGQYSLTELRSIQDWIIKFNLQNVPGVTEVLGIGGFEKQFHVEVEPLALERYGFTVNEVIERIEDNNLNIGAQFIENNNEEYVVRSVGLATSLEDIRSILMGSSDGIPITVGDVAAVKEGRAIRRGLQTKDGVAEVVSGQVIKLFGANASTVIQSVEDKIEQINQSLPEGVNIVPYYEQKTLVESAVNTVTSALAQGIVLVALVLIIFMGGWRPTIVVATALPFSVLFATLGMYYFGISANLMSLGGLAIAIGMLVDGAIVVVENVDQHLREASPRESKMGIVARACGEVARPVGFAVAIVILVFLPLFTLTGVEGKTFRPLAYAIALAMSGALIYALIVGPTLAYFLMRAPKKKNTEGEDSAKSGESLIVRVLQAPYRPLVTLLVKQRWIAVVGAVALLAAGVWIFPKLGTEFTPSLNEGTIVVKLKMAPSISIDTSKQMTQAIERRILEVPEVTKVVTRIGRGEVGAHADPINAAELYLSMTLPEEWREPFDQEAMVEVIREAIGKPPGVVVNYTQPIEMSVDELLEGVQAELAVKLFGEDLDLLLVKANEIAATLGEVEGARDVQVDQVTGSPQLLIRINRGAAARYNLNVGDIQRVIQAGIGGKEAGLIFEGIRRYEILVRYPESYRGSVGAISETIIRSPDGSLVPLDEVATIEELVGPRQITRERSQRFIAIQCNVTGRDIGSFVAEAEKAIASEVDLPAGYLTTWGGSYKLQQEANKRFAVVIPITLLLILLMIYAALDSLKNSMLILLNIPLALVGGIAALWLAGENLSVPATVGFIALFGIALGNGLVLITYTNQLMREGLDVGKASVEAACRRLRPVLMTAITTGLGLLPLLLATGTGSEVQRPLALVVTGGLVSSTLLTLLVVPALYKWFAINPNKEA
ncbi:CusA/CzcA family heavy metal efflux RND transporter [Coraliomargarita sp. SDUM461004]|uniref:CusA/CzcA family heavy metal efflux RND transporter n=1 Tax=Thalassobacterium sedimentorum TaxID=3041258 RepID=A0ABU1ANS5_9BACT|nr:CusA/CzcA family heavy metal efflux RND transporter [Coraliomargarita sp. SDUM461004]MDQ8195263.1 CusA/CzcA family heavy metal efflux RND transporter [Coraliomargarita sp. SDUM461004]